MLIWIYQHLWRAHSATAVPLGLRALLAAGTSLLLALLLWPRAITWLAARFREPIKSGSADVDRLQQAKEATPTMGGLFIVAAILGTTLLFGDWNNPYLFTSVVLTIGLTIVGGLDDLVKLRSRARGLPPWCKVLGQTLVASLSALIVFQAHAAQPQGLNLPMPLADFATTDADKSLGIFFVPLAVLVIVASSNAVNLTDGLDGLAGGCVLFSAAALMVMTIIAQNAELAAVLHLPHIAMSGEMLVLASGLVGAVVGFLWFNCHPAQVFMGDTGALPLGGLLGLMAIVVRQELLFVLVGGVFVAETLSVVLQVSYYRWRRKRLFRCAPLHHHFQFLGWSEGKIVVRFWIASALCALTATAALGLRAKNEPPAEKSVLTAGRDAAISR
jgi:phospho-N-acetylmuramoyl-pentapeptide-transferase